MTRRLAAFVGVLLAFGATAVAAVSLWPPRDGDTTAGTTRPPVADGPPPGVAAPSRAPRKAGGAAQGYAPVASGPALRFALRPVTGTLPVTAQLKHPPAAGILFDVGTGEVLWQRRPQLRHPIASLTKMMTALLVSHADKPDDRVRISRKAASTPGSATGMLPRGKRVPLEPLLQALIMISANDAAVALADRMAGTDRRFAEVMNRRASELRLSCTHYVSSYGLQRGNRSCAADLAALARILMSKPRIAAIARHRRASVPFPYLKGKHLDVYSTNPLMRLGYRGTIGLKTGYTEPAGHCFVGVARRGERTLGVVLLKSVDTGSQAMRLLNAGFRAVKAGGA